MRRSRSVAYTAAGRGYSTFSAISRIAVRASTTVHGVSEARSERFDPPVNCDPRVSCFMPGW